MAYCLEFTLPGLPRMTNTSGRKTHWAVKAKEAREWKRDVLFAVGAKRPPTPLEHASLTLTRYSSMAPDADGLVSGFKHVIDGLVEAKVLAGDTFEHIGMPTYRWERALPRRGSITVRVEEVCSSS